jgi:hypothetical protein
LKIVDESFPAARTVPRRREDYFRESSREVMYIAIEDGHSLRPQPGDLICADGDHHLTKDFAELPLVEMPAGAVKEKLRKFPGDLGNDLVELFACHHDLLHWWVPTSRSRCAESCASDRNCWSGLRLKASFASGEAADGGEAWHQTGADFYGFDPTGFD